jgi:hypothetical protein
MRRPDAGHRVKADDFFPGRHRIDDHAVKAGLERLGHARAPVEEHIQDLGSEGILVGRLDDTIAALQEVCFRVECRCLYRPYDFGIV